MMTPKGLCGHHLLTVCMSILLLYNLYKLYFHFDLLMCACMRARERLCLCVGGWGLDGYAHVHAWNIPFHTREGKDCYEVLYKSLKYYSRTEKWCGHFFQYV